MNDDKLKGFSVEHLCELPANLAKTELGVRPCVAFLRPSDSSFTSSSSAKSSTSTDAQSVEDRLIPRLDPKEVAAVFTAPFASFLHKSWTGSGPGPIQKNGKPEKWYRGSWTDWHESRWRMHNFYIPRPPQTARNPSLAQPPSSPEPKVHQHLPEGDDPAPEPNPLDELSAFRVFGMTARILVDAARVAYGEEPEFEHNSHFGDEEMIGALLRMGRLGEVRREGDGLTKELLREASKM